VDKMLPDPTRKPLLSTVSSLRGLYVPTRLPSRPRMSCVPSSFVRRVPMRAPVLSFRSLSDITILMIRLEIGTSLLL